MVVIQTEYAGIQYPDALQVSYTTIFFEEILSWWDETKSHQPTVNYFVMITIFQARGLYQVRRKFSYELSPSRTNQNLISQLFIILFP